MERTITLDGRVVAYLLRPNKRSKKISVTMHPDGRLVVSTPVSYSLKLTEKFLNTSKPWIFKQISSIENSEHILVPSHRKKEQILYFEFAKIYIGKIIAEVNSHYDLPINQIRVKNHKAQWGSASHKRNLNFNYKLIFLPPHLAKYVIVHELCHLKEMNHSKEFWRLVGEIIHSPKSVDKELSKYHLV